MDYNTDYGLMWKDFLEEKYKGVKIDSLSSFFPKNTNELENSVLKFLDSLIILLENHFRAKSDNNSFECFIPPYLNTENTVELSTTSQEVKEFERLTKQYEEKISENFKNSLLNLNDFYDFFNESKVIPDTKSLVLYFLQFIEFSKIENIIKIRENVYEELFDFLKSQSEFQYLTDIFFKIFYPENLNFNYYYFKKHFTIEDYNQLRTKYEGFKEINEYIATFIQLYKGFTFHWVEITDESRTFPFLYYIEFTNEILEFLIKIEEEKTKNELLEEIYLVNPEFTINPLEEALNQLEKSMIGYSGFIKGRRGHANTYNLLPIIVF